MMINGVVHPYHTKTVASGVDFLGWIIFPIIACCGPVRKDGCLRSYALIKERKSGSLIWGYSGMEMLTSYHRWLEDVILWATGHSVTANILALGASDSGFESRHSDKYKKAH